jgi:predicted metal-binding protein
MSDLENKQYVVIVQCDIVVERCSGYFCEKAFHQRMGGLAVLSKNRPYRAIYMTCGGCCGRALQRKLSHLVRKLAKDGVGGEQILVQLSSCVVKDNFHAPPCPHLDYLRTLISRMGLDVGEGTVISELAEKRRSEGRYTNC